MPDSESLPADCDVAIIGGGPAGSAAARLLSRWTRSVIVLTRSPPRHTLAVSLPPSCRKLFETAGVLRQVDAAGFFPSTGNTVWWGGEARSETFADGLTGYQVVHRDFDRLLLEAAEEEGARVRRNAQVREVTWPSADGLACISFDEEGESRRIRARMVLDCSGRAGVIARHGLRVYEKGSTTVALVGVWRKAGGWGLDEESHTLVESYEDGWVWSIPVSPDIRYFTPMVDPRVTGLRRDESASGRQIESVYRAELSKAPHINALLEGADAVEQPFGCDASLHSAKHFTGPGFLLVGDAASCLDPLSSYGVKKALASGWMAAIVANTCVSNPDLEAPARELYESRERAVWEACRQQSVRFFESAAADHGHPFWTGRADAADAASQDPAGDADLDIDELRRDPAVLAAFETLKHTAAIRLVDGERLERVQRPAIRANQVVLQTQLQTPSLPAVRFLRSVDLAELVDLAAGYDQVPDLFEAYNRRCPPVILPDFLGALSVLLAREVLVNTISRD